METYLFTCCTGSGGNVGGHAARAVYRRAREAGRPVRIRLGARSPEKAAGLFADLDDVEITELDFSRPESYLAALDGTAGVFLGTSETGDFDSEERLAEFLEAAKRAGGPHVVRILGSGLVEDAELDFRELIAQSGCQLLDGHVMAHRILGDARAQGAATITFVDVMSWFFQNFVAYYDFLIHAGTLGIPNGDAALPHVDSRDVGEFVAAVLLGGRPYQNRDFVLTGAHRLTGTEWAALISEATGRTIRYADDGSLMQAAYSEIEVAPGASLWDVMAPMNELERLVGKAVLRLRPDVFEEVTQRKHRSPAAFCREVAAGGAWEPPPS